MYPESCRLVPYDHQRVGTARIVELTDVSLGRVLSGCGLNADEMGAGKSKQVIDAACELWSRGEIDRVIVVTVAACRRGVWWDPDMGELAKHLWEEVPSKVFEYHQKVACWYWRSDLFKSSAFDARLPLEWFVANYEYLRPLGKKLRKKDPAPKQQWLVDQCDERTLLVLDESSAVKSSTSLQTKACFKLRWIREPRRPLRPRCGRVVELNGTPIDNSPDDAYSQAAVLDPRILGCNDHWEFLGRYAVRGGDYNAVVKWVNLEDLRQRMAPYVVRRLKEDCLDLPPKLPPVTIDVPLSPATWKLYRGMRDEFMAWLDGAKASEAPQAGVRAMRLAQITSGFLGGVEEELADGSFVKLPIEEIGTEKLDALTGWLVERLEEDPEFKLLVWCRFRPEIERLLRVLPRVHAGMHVGAIWGGQHKDDRRRSIGLLDPTATPKGPCVVPGTPGAGSLGLNLTAAHHVMRASSDYRLSRFQQGNDRIHRPGQTKPCWYGDLMATGPTGQKTIDHVIAKALRSKQDLAEWTCAAWRDEFRKLAAEEAAAA